MINVENITNDLGNQVRNQFIVKRNGNKYFHSYQTTIAKIDRNGKVTLSGGWDYSQTTTKYLCLFLRQNGYYKANKAYIRKMIANGTFALKKKI